MFLEKVAGSSNKPEAHFLELDLTLTWARGKKRGLAFVFFGNSDLPIPRCQIQCDDKIMATLQEVQQSLNVRQWVQIFSRDSVEGPIVNTHPDLPGFLRFSFLLALG